ncbi:hypothetical protein BC937DRAFT_93642 [Endogone sp. FLAS-F59071]|nr:hypothetical protein BC937DRAFT_93642 [Endogone sp. FLAS-F59071]|eukprot:RUS14559.1 hypothetical protein BC937DRAFT_93642 [Endogone sp. FLAS-F59071]
MALGTGVAPVSRALCHTLRLGSFFVRIKRVADADATARYKVAKPIENRLNHAIKKNFFFLSVFLTFQLPINSLHLVANDEESGKTQQSANAVRAQDKFQPERRKSATNAPRRRNTISNADQLHTQSDFSPRRQTFLPLQQQPSSPHSMTFGDLPPDGEPFMPGSWNDPSPLSSSLPNESFLSNYHAGFSFSSPSLNRPLVPAHRGDPENSDSDDDDNDDGDVHGQRFVDAEEEVDFENEAGRAGFYKVQDGNNSSTETITEKTRTPTRPTTPAATRAEGAPTAAERDVFRTQRMTRRGSSFSLYSLPPNLDGIDDEFFDRKRSSQPFAYPFDAFGDARSINSEAPYPRASTSTFLSSASSVSSRSSSSSSDGYASTHATTDYGTGAPFAEEVAVSNPLRVGVGYGSYIVYTCTVKGGSVS